MFTQPTNCCFFFSLRSAALALPFLHILSDAVALGLMYVAPASFWISAEVFRALLVIYAIGAVVNLGFFVGVAKVRWPFPS